MNDPLTYVSGFCASPAVSGVAQSPGVSGVAQSPGVSGVAQTGREWFKRGARFYRREDRLHARAPALRRRNSL